MGIYIYNVGGCDKISSKKSYKKKKHENLPFF